MEEKDLQNELASIRSIMERSSKFISLSGLSGILAGAYALIGAGIAYFICENNPVNIPAGTLNFDSLGKAVTVFYSLAAIAVIVLVASIFTAILLSKRQAERKNQSIWGAASRSLLFYTFVPLFTGGLVVLLFLYRGNFLFIVPAMLIFYGLSLVSASNFTFRDVKYLGILEIILGLIAACLPGYGLLFWAIGFGLLHIIYGSMMYLKYDK